MSSTKLRAGAITVFVIALLAFAVWQHQRAQRLAADNAALREQLEQLRSLREENQRLAGQLKAAAQDAESRSRELLRLRAQAATLRQTVQENARLKVERDRLAG